MKTSTMSSYNVIYIYCSVFTYLVTVVYNSQSYQFAQHLPCIKIWLSCRSLPLAWHHHSEYITLKKKKKKRKNCVPILHSLSDSHVRCLHILSKQRRFFTPHRLLLIFYLVSTFSTNLLLSDCLLKPRADSEGVDWVASPLPPPPNPPPKKNQSQNIKIYSLKQNMNTSTLREKSIKIIYI